MSISKYNFEGYRDLTAYSALLNIEKQKRVDHLNRLKRRVHDYRPLVYLCAPVADVVNRPEQLRAYCQFITSQRAIPISPSLLFQQFLFDPDEQQRALGAFMSNILLTKCMELWVFGEQITRKMAVEIDRAEDRGMTIRYFSSNCEEVLL